jgi:hypothetical protein
LNQKEIKMFKNRFLIVLGVLSLLLVAMAITSPLSNTPTSLERGRAAYATRYRSMAEYYIKLEETAFQRSQTADAARWTAIAERYQSVEAAQNLSRGKAADAARWTAMANYYLQVFGK